jgi:hypothetical protein
MRQLLKYSNSVILIVAFVSIVGLLATIAGAEITPTPGIEVETYYVNPHGCHVVSVGDVGECINSFDFFKNHLYYTTGKKIMTNDGLSCDVGFKVYKVLGKSHNVRVAVDYDEVFGFSGGRIRRYGNCMLFNDGGEARYERMFYYYIFDPQKKPKVVNKLYDSTQPPAYNLWGLSTRRGTEFWAAGTPPFPNIIDNNKIFYSSIDFNDDEYGKHCDIDYSDFNQTVISIGDVGPGGTGPLAFDSHGDLYYAQGWNGSFFTQIFYDSLIYHFTADEVAAAINDPNNEDARLKITDQHVWATISISDGIGASSMIFVEDIGLVLTVTSFHGDSQLGLFPVNQDGTSGDYTKLADSKGGRMPEVRYRLGKIYFSDPDGIYYIDVNQLFDDDD